MHDLNGSNIVISVIMVMTTTKWRYLRLGDGTNVYEDWTVFCWPGYQKFLYLQKYMHTLWQTINTLNSCDKWLASINVVNRHWAQLLLGWVTAYGQVNCLGT